MRLKILLVALTCCLTTPLVAFGEEAFTLYLVRHAEKRADGGRDPTLTIAGEQRAAQLATWLIDKDIKDIWSSDYRRTRDTAKPSATRFGIETSIYDPGSQPVLVGHLLARQDNALIVGHSNTIPELARMLCECEVADMDETEYDRLIVVMVGGDGARAETLKQGDLF